MNILFVTLHYYPHIGGVERHVERVSHELSKDGHKISILVIENHGGADYEENNHISVYRLRKRNRLYQILRLWGIFKQAEIIHFHDFVTFWKYGIRFLPILKLLKKAVYITFHGWEGSCPPTRSIVIKRKICEKLVDRNMCIGHFIEKWYGTRADIVSYGGVKKVAELGEDKGYALFIGRLSDDTGIVKYIKAWKKINKEYRDLKLIVCGDGTLKKTLEEQVIRENIQNVEFKGFVENPEDYVKNARIVFASGYLGILEAFSYKKPVIGTYDHELKKDYLELFPDSKSMLWVAGNCEEIVSSVKSALSNSEKIERGYEFASENSWEKVKKDYYFLWRC